MKLATLKAGGRDGTLVVVSRDLAQARRVPEIAHTPAAGAGRLGRNGTEARRGGEAAGGGGRFG